MGEAVAGGVLVLAAAYDNSDRIAVGFAAEPVTAKCDLEIKLPGVFRLNLPGLQFEHEVPLDRTNGPGMRCMPRSPAGKPR